MQFKKANLFELNFLDYLVRAVHACMHACMYAYCLIDISFSLIPFSLIRSKNVGLLQTYMPLFMDIHASIVSNPLHTELGLGSPSTASA